MNNQRSARKQAGCRPFVLLAIRTICALAMLSTAFAQKQNRWGEPSDDDPKYDPKTDTTVAGTVQEISSNKGRRNTPRTEVTIKTSAETVHANLGPSVFLDKIKFKLIKGSKITVSGSSVMTKRGQRVLARTVEAGGHVFVLRDD